MFSCPGLYRNTDRPRERTTDPQETDALADASPRYGPWRSGRIGDLRASSSTCRRWPRQSHHIRRCADTETTQCLCSSKGSDLVAVVVSCGHRRRLGAQKATAPTYRELTSWLPAVKIYTCSVGSGHSTGDEFPDSTCSPRRFLMARLLRTLALIGRKAGLQKLLTRKRSRIPYRDHVEDDGRLLFEPIVAMEGHGNTLRQL